MSDFKAQSICILGRQPALGLAELEAMFGSEHIMPINEAAILDISTDQIPFQKLGGTIKVAKILDILPFSSWNNARKYIEENIPKHLAYASEGKVTIGLSVYGLQTDPESINRVLLGVKKRVKKDGRSLRIVPNKSLELNSAQVLHNKLTSRGAWELLLIANGDETILAQTMFIQDIDSYSARDQNRPMRDAKVGMLPPKLAQIIINLAVGKIDSRLQLADSRSDSPNSEPLTPNYELRTTILDPFCGTGVILQEALLDGYKVIGTDLEPRMIEYTNKNLEWLKQQMSFSGKPEYLEAGDATNHQWNNSKSITAIACESYLGRPFTSPPNEDVLRETIGDCNTIIKKFLKNIQPQLNPKTRLCVAVPSWRAGGKMYHLPVIDQLTDMGYNILDLVHVAKTDLIYYREDQIVARELLILEIN